MRVNQVKAGLKKGLPQVGTWLSMASPLAARFLARTQFDWLTVDMEHAPYSWETAAEIFASVADAGKTPLVRVPVGAHDQIKRALDFGAFGIVVPMVLTEEQARAAVSAMKYPPTGNRSVGGSIHSLNYDADPATYYERANDEILVILQCEHIETVRNADRIFSVPGVDVIFVGPNDLWASMRSKIDEPVDLHRFEEKLTTIRKTCKKYGISAGIHTFSPAEAERRLEQGWTFVAVGSDLSLMLDGAARAAEKITNNQTGKKGGNLANY
jgi:4-hydroxy-2-oxoheptanedioate aldolase